VQISENDIKIPAAFAAGIKVYLGCFPAKLKIRKDLRDYFVFQPPLCCGSVNVYHSTDVGPFAAPNQAANGNLCIVRG